ncbi:LysR family transcriptional regulator [Hydrogenophaga laconesensis]|uniref:DNA-binding transcriptional LysR family regulator n=1 Tax=Hydrogenophaga laconesensis TaxID=1805971 RepID=A0ABU1VBF3_9BURK|nr:LysR family transcriptional regulator [Hydrogenophaga laconesensis]MDR7094794.1 DNA-binding transcriptional LysR family regulator [Hydrogenophaga laconesensis]
MLSERNFARQIDLTSLQLFVAVCESGSIGRAAEREFIAASAISKRLSDLENTLGTPLLNRHARGVRLTPAGEGLLHHARAVLFGLEKMQVELAEYADGVRGHVRVHASISAIVQFLPEDLGAFARSHPQIKIDLEEHLSPEVLRAVKEGATDLGLCNGATGTGGLQSRPYRRDRLVLVVPRGHALAGGEPIAFEAALPYDHVGLHANSSIHLATHQAATEAGTAVRVRIRVTGLDAMCRMIANGLGVGVMPERAFHLLSTDDSLLAAPLTDAWAQRQLVLVARDFSSLPTAARLLVEHLAATDSPQST